jgi:hypothetical protein
MSKRPVLDLTVSERAALGRAGIALGTLADTDAADLAAATGIAPERCEQLVALAGFQRLGSIGPASATDLWRLGFRSVDQLVGADPRQLYERLGEMTGSAHDPCVEDVLRCAVAQATFGELDGSLRQWWMWSDQRGDPSVRLSAAAR